MGKNINIKRVEENDISSLYQVIDELGFKKPDGYFEKIVAEQNKGLRDIFLASADRPLGYTTLIWHADNLPEINDLNVVEATRGQGIGSQLIQACENRVREKGGKQISIGVGLYPGYGAAQRLYPKLGYVPDGKGIYYDDKPVEAMQTVVVDDSLFLRMIKEL